MSDDNYLQGVGAQATYGNRFTCVKKTTPWRPMRGLNSVDTRILAPQTAIVVGPEGESLYTDGYGRVLLQFHWDREGKYTTWVRVSSGWACIRHLIKTRKAFCDAWMKKSDKPVTEMPKLHLLIVIPHPELDQVIPRTYDSLTELGYAQKVDGIEAMPEQRKLSDKGTLTQSYPNSRKGPKGGQVLDRPSVEQLQQTLGLQVSVARLRTSGPDAKGNMAYREIYIHAKLMIIDDAFITVGSANMNQRSMSVDSEINIAATGHLYATDLRQRVFNLHTGGASLGSGNPKELPDEFDSWNKIMSDNLSKMKKNKPMQGFLLPFEDHRSTTVLLGAIDVPSSNETAIT